MTSQSWLMYLTLVLAATSVPGPAVLFIVTNAAAHGWRKSTYAALGNIAGLFCLGALSIAGLGTILKTSELFFNLIKYAGAAYLIFLGIKLFFQKPTSVLDDREPSLPIKKSGKKSDNDSGRHLLLHAFGVAISNPKAIIFLTALFPQFINVNRALIPQFTILIAVLMVFSFLFLMSYALLAHKATIWLTNSTRIKRFNQASGSVFIGFGLLLATSSQ